MKSYQNTDQLLHLLCQTIAKINKITIESKEDDSHTNLYFDLVGNRMLGRWFQAENGERMIMSLSLSNFKFECLNEKLSVVLAAKTVGRTIQKTERKLAEKLKAKGVLSTPFPTAMHYDIPAYPFAKRKIRRPLAKKLNYWTHFRTLANSASYQLLGFLQGEAEVRIWPHHFDTGIYFQGSDELGIGFGLAMKDDLLEEPYFYLTGYPANGSLNYDDLPILSRGYWLISDSFKGAVLPLKVLRNKGRRKTNHLLDIFVAEATLRTIRCPRVEE